MKRILVTGATGFVGGHVLEALLEVKGVNLIAACRDPGRLPAAAKRIEKRVGDLRDQHYRADLCEEVDVLVHSAAWTSLYGNAKNSERYFLQPTLELIETALQAGVKRFVFISTTSAAAPDTSCDAHSRGIPRPFWPHLCNVIKIEDRLRTLAEGFETVVNLRLGLFVGERYNLGLLPILLPRLKTHLVPWVGGGATSMPLIDGRDIGQAVAKAATVSGLAGFESFNVVGPETPTVREVIGYLHDHHGYPKPHFGVPFALAYPFAWLMETLDPLLPWDPLVTRSIIHLLEETAADNREAAARLGYSPKFHWRDSIDSQIREMNIRQLSPMPMQVKVE